MQFCAPSHRSWRRLCDYSTREIKEPRMQNMVLPNNGTVGCKLILGLVNCHGPVTGHGAVMQQVER